MLNKLLHLLVFNSFEIDHVEPVYTGYLIRVNGKRIFAYKDAIFLEKKQVTFEELLHDLTS